MTTHATATQLATELDAMRRARAEDEKTCARLTARVKELEAEVAKLRSFSSGKVTVRGSYSCAGEHTWVQGNDPEFQGCNRCPAERTTPLAQIAEGTRNEVAEHRCPRCFTPQLSPGPCGPCVRGAQL